MAIETAAHKLAADLIDRRESINRELARNGVRFGIYHDGVYNDRLFPYDPIPRAGARPQAARQRAQRLPARHLLREAHRRRRRGA